MLAKYLNKQRSISPHNNSSISQCTTYLVKKLVFHYIKNKNNNLYFNMHGPVMLDVNPQTLLKRLHVRSCAQVRYVPCSGFNDQT
jgi:hypothetical protein